MSQNPLNLLQRMLHSRANQQAMQINPRPFTASCTTVKKAVAPPIWFDMQLYHAEQSVDAIEAWGMYTLILKSYTEPTSFQDALHSEGIKNLEALQLYVQCVAGKRPIFDHKIQPNDKDTYSFQRTFTIEIPADLQADTLTLKLYTLAPTPEQIGSNTLPVTYSLITTLLSQECVTNQIKPDIPPEVAIVNINSHPQLDHTLAFTIRGQNATALLKQQTYESEIIANIPQLMHLSNGPTGKYQDAIEIRGHMRSFSQEFSPLISGWLQKLQQAHKDKLTLIIIDTSRMEIPWEMIELVPYEYIGTVATVARWQPQKPTNSPNIMLTIHPQIHKGAVLYYLDKHLGHYIEQEREAIQSLEAESCTSLEKLEARLYGSLDQFGLIYIGCHGGEGRRLQEQYPNKLTANRLNVIDSHEEARPIAFINACESARIIRGDPNDNSSFVNVMLQNLVSGYIGTLAKVGLEEASIIARDFMEQGKTENGLPIAQILRNLRRIAAKELFRLRNMAACEEQKRVCEYKFLYTFLYVYYGNPLARLQLIPRSTLNLVDVTISPQTIEEQSCNN